MHREDLVVDIGAEEAALREGQLGADKQRFKATEKEEEHRGNAVHDADLLVVDRADPVLPTAVGLGPGQNAERPLRVLLTTGEG